MTDAPKRPRGRPPGARKGTLNLSLDLDLIAALRAEPGYTARVNAALRTMVGL